MSIIGKAEKPLPHNNNTMKKLLKKIPEIKNEFIYGKQSEFDENHNVIGTKEEASPYCVGSLEKGYSLELSEKIFESMEAFAKYASSKIAIKI